MGDIHLVDIRACHSRRCHKYEAVSMTEDSRHELEITLENWLEYST